MAFEAVALLEVGRSQQRVVVEIHHHHRWLGTIVLRHLPSGSEVVSMKLGGPVVCVVCLKLSIVS